MFKKTEESEWTRFSRALGGNKEQPREREEIAQPEDELVVEQAPAMTAATPPPPPSPIPTAPAEPVAAPVQTAPPPVSPEPMFAGETASGSAPGSLAPALEPLPAVAQPVSSTAASSPRGGLEEDTESVIAEGTELEGSFRAEHSVRVRGAIQGEIASKRQIVIEAGATVNAKVTAEQITIRGEVNGEVTCSGRVEIAPNGRVTGEISAGTLVMQEGGFFEGQLKMLNRGG